MATHSGGQVVKAVVSDVVSHLCSAVITVYTITALCLVGGVSLE